MEEKLPEGNLENIFGSTVAPDHPSTSSIWALLLGTIHRKNHHVRILLLVPQDSQISKGSEVTSHGTTLDRVTTLLSICSAQMNLFCEQDKVLYDLIEHLHGVLDFSSLVATHDGPLGEIVIWHGEVCEDGLLSTSQSSWIGGDGNRERAIEGLRACFKQIRRRSMLLKESMDDSELNLDTFIAEGLRNLALDRIPSNLDSIANKGRISDFLDEVLEENTVRKVLQLREMVNGRRVFLCNQ